MTLTIRAIDSAKPKEKPYKLADAGGLYLAVLPTGGKSWRFNHTEAGKQKTKTYGTYPAMSLADARMCHAAFKDRGQSVGSQTFKDVAEAWLKVKLPTLRNTKHQIQIAETLARHVYPAIGSRPIAEIRRVDLVAVVNSVKSEKGADITETAHRVAGRITKVFEYAQDLGLIDSHPASGLTRVLPPKKIKRHMPSIGHSEAVALLSAIQSYDEPVTRLALLLMAHTFVRVGELRGMLRSELILSDAVWLVPGERMKVGVPHVVPLSTQATALIAQLQALSRSDYVIESPLRAGQPISENTLLFALYRLGYRGRMTVHGFRALASSVLNEHSPFSKDAIERQLAHKETDQVRAAYNRAEYLPERRRLMQWWSDWLVSQAGAAAPRSSE